MNEFEQDLTVGAVPTQLWKFTVPLFFANLLQVAYSIVDMIAVGHWVGAGGLAAVSNASVLCFMITSIGIGISIGGTVLVARSRGAHDRTTEHETVGTLFGLTALIAIPVTLAGLGFNRAIFRWLGVPEEVLPEACAYMNIQCGGTVLIFGYNAVCALLRGLGDSRRPLLFIAIATAVNIGLDVWLVGGMNLGSAGAAWGTVISQGVALAVALGYLGRRGFFRDFQGRDFLLKWPVAMEILKTGVPTALQMLVVNFAFLLVTGMFNRYGVAAAAAAGIGLKVGTLVGMPCWAVGQAVTAMAAQNLGAGKIARTAETARIGIWFSLIATGVMVLLTQIFAEQVIGCFNSEPEVLAKGVYHLRIFCSFGGLAYAAMYTCDAFATGTGAASLALVNALLEAIVLRLVLCWFLATFLGLGFVGLCWGMSLSTLPPALIGLAYYHWGKWRRGGDRRQVPAQDQEQAYS